ncbi:MAG: hypothetical protein KatS3mg014_0793 [Actinomycetota bacterium]|nr:MAG: hypothetical protein KatS3mg014_0793 [Actinomycetota bacterium]
MEPNPRGAPREKVIVVIEKLAQIGEGRKLRRLEQIVAQVNALEPEMEALSDAELQGKTGEFRQRLDRGEEVDNLLIEAFAVTREAARRVIGQRHYDVQLIGGDRPCTRARSPR